MGGPFERLAPGLRQPFALRIALAVGVIAVCGVLAAREVLPDGSSVKTPAPPPQPSLQSADPSIVAVMIEAPTTTVWSDVKNAPSITGNIDKAEAQVAAVRAALRRGVSDNMAGVDTVRVRLRSEALDRFGHDLMAPLMTLDYALADLKAPGTARPLGLARTVTLGAPGAYDAVASWCKDTAKADAAFCAKAQK